MDLVIAFVIGGAACAIWDLWRRTRVAVDWSKTVVVGLPEPVARSAVAQYFKGRGCTDLPLKKGTGYTRGDRSIGHVSVTCNIGWREVPMIVGTGMAGLGSETTICVNYSSCPGVRFSPAAARFFIEQAAGEFNGLISFLEAVATKRSEPSGTGPGANGRHRHRWMPEDDAGGAKQARPHDASHDADLALLGLDRGATLEQIKKAYRVACHKYHPDRLTGQNVEPYLIELAVQRFKEVSAAHQRLCEHFAQPQHA